MGLAVGLFSIRFERPGENLLLQIRQRALLTSAFCPCRFAQMYLLINQLWSISSTTLQTRIKLQLSMILFGKTLVKKDLAGSARDEEKEKGKDQTEAEDNKAKDGESSKEDEDVSSKSQIIVSRS